MTAQPNSPEAGRLRHLDGLRTVAIVWVALYHYAVFWSSAGKGTNLLPYDDALARVPLADVGEFGVYLFFVISGFVIAMSLTRSPSIGAFCLNRAIRLWPTLLICGTITFALTTLLGPDALRRSLLEFLFSLTFIPPPHLGAAVGIQDLEWLDGAYWSLWTEVRFYLIAALIYFLKRDHFLLLWTAFAIACTALHMADTLQTGEASAVARLLFTEHQPYFTAGIALASLHGQTTSWARWLLSLAMVQAFAYPALSSSGLSTQEAAGLVLVFVLAIPVLLSRGPVPVLSSRPFVLLGIGSYAFYLLHQNAGLALLTLAEDMTVGMSILAMLSIQAAIAVFAVGLTLYVEAPLRRFLRARATRRVTHPTAA